MQRSNTQKIRKLNRELNRTDYSSTLNLALIIITAAFFAPALIIVVPLIAIQTISVWSKIRSLENKITKIGEA